jgi:primosomal protein N' (replication factor Y) (superfamily II helicase)
VDDRTEQLTLLRAQIRTTRAPSPSEMATHDPVAEVLPEVGLPHLDRGFDYLVPASMDAAVVPGSRVRVRFSGRDVAGFVVARKPASEHAGQLTPVRRSVAAEPVLSAPIARLCRQVADRYAGTASDVVRLAVPPRHARTEAAERAVDPTAWDAPPEAAETDWAGVPGGPAFLRRLAAGQHPHAAWTALPGDPWASMLAGAAAAALRGGRGSVLLVPERRDVDVLDAALTGALGPGRHVVLTADLGPAARYRAFLGCLRGDVPIVVGTRAAAFAPVQRLGLLAIWDDGDDAYAEERAPYPHAREVLRLRADLEGAAMLLAGQVRSTDAAALVRDGWAHGIGAPTAERRARSARVHVTGESDAELARDPAATTARVPHRVFEVVREALPRGPVLIHTPRQGYLPSLLCATCGERSRCTTCGGPLRRTGGGGPATCEWCARSAEGRACPRCGGTGVRAPVVGAARTVEEWGRSFPSTPVLSSTAEHRVDEVADAPMLVIATPGAEPRAPHGYAAAVLLDTWLTLYRPALRAAEEAFRRWANVAAAVRPAASGGRVVAVGEASSPVLQALVRADPDGFAERDLDERIQARLPPATYVATLTGAPDSVAEALAGIDLPEGSMVLGPVARAEEEHRVVVSAPRGRGPALAHALKQLQATRSARKLPPVRVHVDPLDL